MANEIKEFQAAPDRGLYVPSSYGARVMNMGSNWTKLNVGMRLRNRLVGSTNPTSKAGQIYFGLCNGTTAPVGSATPAHFIGVKNNYDPWLWTSVANTSWTVGWRITSI